MHAAFSFVSRKEDESAPMQPTLSPVFIKAVNPDPSPDLLATTSVVLFPGDSQWGLNQLVRTHPSGFQILQARTPVAPPSFPSTTTRLPRREPHQPWLHGWKFGFRDKGWCIPRLPFPPADSNCGMCCFQSGHKQELDAACCEPAWQG